MSELPLQGLRHPTHPPYASYMRDVLDPGIRVWGTSCGILDVRLRGVGCRVSAPPRTRWRSQTRLFFFFNLVTGPGRSLSLKLSDTNSIATSSLRYNSTRQRCKPAYTRAPSGGDLERRRGGLQGAAPLLAPPPSRLLPPTRPRSAHPKRETLLLLPSEGSRPTRANLLAPAVNP